MFTCTHGWSRGAGLRGLWVALFGFLVTGILPVEAQTGTTRVVMAADPGSITDQNTLTYVITVSNSSLTVTSEVTCSQGQPGLLWVTGVSATNPDALAVAEVITNYSYSHSFEWRSGPIRPGRVVVFTMTGDLWDGLQVAGVTNVVHVNVRYTNSIPSSESFAVTNVAQVSNNDADNMADFFDPDDDNDGMADYWERYYGLDSHDASDAALDTDNDGVTNIDEYRAYQAPNGGNYQPLGYDSMYVNPGYPSASDITGFPFKTIQGAMRAALDGETIRAEGTFTGTVEIARNVRIVGNYGTVISGASNVMRSTVFVRPGVTAAVEGVTFRDGRAPRGGAVYNEGTLTVSNSTFESNLATGTHYSVYDEPYARAEGGAVYNARGGKLACLSCTFYSNSAVGGPSPSSGYDGYGGALYNNGIATMGQVIVLGNFANGGPMGGGYSGPGRGWGGGIFNGTSGVCVIENSAIVSNAAYVAGTIHAPTPAGGGLFNQGRLELRTCTVAANRAGLPVVDYPVGGEGGGLCNSATALVFNSTFCRNDAGQGGQGGGIANGELDPEYYPIRRGHLEMVSTLVAENTNPLDPASSDCAGVFHSGGYNLIQATNGFELVGGTHDLFGVDALLGELAVDETYWRGAGGSTWVCPLLDGSPAIDTGTSGGAGRDQRGATRPQDLNGWPNANDASDIGAYEMIDTASLVTGFNVIVTSVPGVVDESTILAYDIEYQNRSQTALNYAWASMLWPGAFKFTGLVSTAFLTGSSSSNGGSFVVGRIEAHSSVWVRIEGVLDPSRLEGVLTNQCGGASFLGTDWLSIASFDVLTPVRDYDSDSQADIIDADDDNDGMPDYWEIYYGLNPLNASDAALNPDHDRRNNAQEYRAHSNPLLDDRAPRVQPPTVDNSNPNASDETGFPFRTITAALKNSLPGDTIAIGGHRYPERLLLAYHVSLVGYGMPILDGFLGSAGIDVLSNVTAEVSGLIIRWGGAAWGGGVMNQGTLTLSSCVISACYASVSTYYSTNRSRGGGVYNGGALTLDRVTIDGCHVNGRGGGVFNDVGARLSVIRSTIAHNDVDGGYYYTYAIGSGDGLGGGIYNEGTLTVALSTISGNVAFGIEGLSAGRGGGIYAAGTVTIESSTVCDNHAWAAYSQATNVGYGAGLYAAGAVSIRNTLIANNVSDAAPDVWGAVTSAGHNLIGSTDGSTISGGGANLYGVDPLLGPLADNGGSTFTHALLRGSPAIDAGNSGGETRDQRGSRRPVDFFSVPNASDSSDIGAFELSRRGALAEFLDDQDGLPAEWERSYGLDPTDPDDAKRDLDGDGYDNVQEYIAGTDPLDATDILECKVRTLADGRVCIEWDGKAGKTYNIERSQGLRAWTLVGTVAPAASGMQQFLDTPLIHGHCYRVKVVE